MRTSVSLILLLFAGGMCHAQGPARTTQPELLVVKYSWSKERIAWERDPFSVPNESYNEMRERVRTERRTRSAIEERTNREARVEQKAPSKPPRYAFNYTLTVSNPGTKSVKEIDWDYVFSDAVSGEEIGRLEFTSLEKVLPGKTKQLSIRVSSPPTRMISVYALGSDERAGLIENIVIMRILYEDGTVWSFQ